MRLFGTDLVLLHPPSVYDFRRFSSEHGPVSDVIFSTPAFEMYPMGLTSLASHLEDHGHNVRIVNLAQRMLADPRYDAEAAIARLNPRMFGIDLHWLPHAHGAIEIARIVKRLHPDAPIVFGGLSASYFHEELVRRPEADFVLRGDSTEEPMLALLRAVLFGEPLDRVPNLTWKKPDGIPVVNPLTHVPERLDGGSVPAFPYVVRSVFKYGSLSDVLPFKGWMRYPITALLTSRGCSMECAVCGGSKSAYRRICHRSQPAYRTPEALVEDLRRVSRFSRGPVFLIHDLRQAGKAYADELLSRLARERPVNEIVLEVFAPVADDYFDRVGAALPRWSLQITLESHLERIRKRNRRFDCPNAAIERTIREALRNGARRVDVFFMVGLPEQNFEDAVGFDDFCRSLLENLEGDRRLEFFVAPLAPFLDPGSAAYEQPEAFGYRKRFETLEDHRRALLSPSWKETLNYDTQWMTRGEIAAATYEGMRRLARLRREWGRLEAEDRSQRAQSRGARRRSGRPLDAVGGGPGNAVSKTGSRVAASFRPPLCVAAAARRARRRARGPGGEPVRDPSPSSRLQEHGRPGEPPEAHSDASAGIDSLTPGFRGPSRFPAAFQSAGTSGIASGRSARSIVAMKRPPGRNTRRPSGATLSSQRTT
jgi:B12-binding domain/radical SAM domain protein